MYVVSSKVVNSFFFFVVIKIKPENVRFPSLCIHEEKNRAIINVSPIMAYYPFGYDGICVCEGENQFCYMTFSFCILYAIGEELCGYILKGCRNGHSEEHDGCGRL